METFVVLARPALVDAASRLDGFAGALTLDNYYGPDATRLSSVPSVRTILLEPDPILVDHFAAIAGARITEYRIVLIRPGVDGTSLLQTPHYQFDGVLPEAPAAPTDRDAALTLTSKVIGFLTDDEMAYLWELASAAPPGHRLEIGSWCGKSASLLASLCRAEGTKLFCVDQWVDRQGDLPWEFYNQFVATMPKPVQGRLMDVFLYQAALYGYLDTLIPLRTRSERVLPLLQTDFGFMFIDADHNYASVKRDALCAIGRLQRGGIVAFHDSNDYFPDVREFVHQEFARRADFALVGQRDSMVAFRKLA